MLANPPETVAKDLYKLLYNIYMAKGFRQKQIKTSKSFFDFNRHQKYQKFHP